MSIDRESPTWRAVREAILIEIECDSLNLEMSQPEHMTNLIRGRLAAYRKVLALADTPPAITDSGELY